MVSEQSLNHTALTSAIIGFSSLQDAVIGLQTSWNCSPGKSFVTPAPASTDIIWDNIAISEIIKYVIVVLPWSVVRKFIIACLFKD